MPPKAFSRIEDLGLNILQEQVLTRIFQGTSFSCIHDLTCLSEPAARLLAVSLPIHCHPIIDRCLRFISLPDPPASP
jgi:hypothetical protein